jgi:hypothetical protein
MAAANSNGPNQASAILSGISLRIVFLVVFRPEWPSLHRSGHRFYGKDTLSNTGQDATDELPDVTAGRRR